MFWAYRHCELQSVNSKLPYYVEESAHDLFDPMRRMVATIGAKKNDKAPQKKSRYGSQAGFLTYGCVLLHFE